MNEYEVTYILRPTLDDEAAEAKSGTIAEAVRSIGGEVVGVDRTLGRRRLAYEINDVREGYYVTMRFRGTADHAKEFDRQTKLTDDVLRHLLLRLDEKDLAEQPVAPPAPVEV
jgi:small subunit ribosomal protein S6